MGGVNQRPAYGALMTGPAPGLLDRLVDDAGLFPPARLAMADAVARHLADRAAGSAVLTHRFLCPSARLTELAVPAGATVDVGLLLSEGGPLPAAPAGVRVAHLECAPGVVPPATDVPVFRELPLAGDWRSALAEAADAGHGVKLRCGGPTQDAFPPAERLAEALVAAHRAGVRAKATAGLHHALPYTDGETGLRHHGFLGLLLAAARAADGADVDDVAAAFSLRAADELVPRLLEARAAAARGLLVSYGSCSTAEPLEDLAALGLLPAGAQTAGVPA
jgi:hypothetical protein